MATVYKKPQNIVLRSWKRFQESRPLQWLALVAVVAIPFSCHKIGQYETRKTSEKLRQEQKGELERSQLEQKAKEEQMQALRKSTEDQERQNQKADLINSLFYFPPLRNVPKAIVLGIDGRKLPENLRDFFLIQLKSQLSKQFPATPFVTDVLLPEFYSTGPFDSAFAGDIGLLNETQFFDHVNTMLLVKPDVRLSKITEVDGMTSCSLTLICRTFSSNHAPSRQATIQTKGTGFSTESSVKNAVEAWGVNQKKELQNLIEGN